MDRAEIKRIVDEWDASGAAKTSLFYRLQSALFDPKKSVAIQRLVDEVKDPKPSPGGGYNRVYHRHNR